MVDRLVDKKATTLEQLQALIRDNGYGIVLISPGRIFTKRYCEDNDDQKMEALLDQVNAIGERYNCLIILNKHLNKKPDRLRTRRRCWCLDQLIKADAAPRTRQD